MENGRRSSRIRRGSRASSSRAYPKAARTKLEREAERLAYLDAFEIESGSSGGPPGVVVHGVVSVVLSASGGRKGQHARLADKLLRCGLVALDNQVVEYEPVQVTLKRGPS